MDKVPPISCSESNSNFKITGESGGTSTPSVELTILSIKILNGLELPS